MSYEKKTSNISRDINEDHNCRIKEEEIHIKDEIAESNETNLKINFAVVERMKADIIRSIKEEVIQEYDSPDYVVCNSKFENEGNYADIKGINIPDKCGFNGTNLKFENEERYKNVKGILNFPCKIYIINKTPKSNHIAIINKINLIEMENAKSVDSFNLQDNLKKNVMLVRTKNKRYIREKKYQCNICQKLFAYSTSLKSHLVVHIGDSKRIKNRFIYKHQCHICLKKFSNKNRLKTHLVIHIGDKKNGKYFLPKAKPSV